MKKLIVLTALVLTATFSLTSCGKKEETTTETTTDTVVTETVEAPVAPADTVAAPAATDTVAVQK
ncbi:hypothetical protein [Flavobacterium subsaxonicum]|uniref:Cytochrome C551 n=1 Tax=Flavobacterium subsaxonicum WB 4.1-42 = DSM 21790 TaxID=1121898 RepID=A0A0A2MP45_9FLAO|nr:hypothetical protein [Flavobacterium subsaxonicum]KGO93203.1 hypothetical protein Q766_07805 [Flavobacterium subsaxonicum WB 4.1-42 = DSM 21790]